MKQLPRIALVACLWPGLGQAQDSGPGGVSFTLGLTQRVEASSDADLATAGADRGVTGTTTLSFGAVTETRSERLALDLGLGLRLSGDDGVMRGDSSAALSYSRSSADAVLSLTAGWSQTNIAFLRDTADFINADGVLVLPDDLDEDVETLGGLVFMLANRVPARGEVVRHPLGHEFEVLDADPRRIKRLRVRLTSAQPEKRAAE